MITTDKLKQFRIDFDKAVKQLSDDYGLDITLGSISYTLSDFHFKLTAKERIVAGIDRNEYEFKRFCQLYDLQPDDYQRTFKYQGKNLTISGIDTKANKNCIVLKDEDGKIYKASSFTVKLALDDRDLHK